MVLMIFICAAIVGAGDWLFYNESWMRTDLKPEGSNAQTFSGEVVQTVSADNFQNLVGRWIRPTAVTLLKFAMSIPTGC